MSVLLIILAAVCVLGPLVALHELGHYVVARGVGVKVLTYSIGFGPALYQWHSKRSGICYQLAAIPLGGYVKMLDEREGDVPESERHLAFNTQTPLKKIAIAVAGPVTNFLIAIGLFWVLLMMPNKTLSTHIGTVLAESPAQTAGLQVDDKIVAIDGGKVKDWQDINYKLADRMGESGLIDITLAHQSQPISVAVTDFMQPKQSEDTEYPLATNSLEALGVLPWQPSIPAVIGQLSDDGVAKQHGLQVNDQIVAINDTLVTDWVQVARIIREHPATALTIEVKRGEQLKQITLTSAAIKDNMGYYRGQVGIAPLTYDYQIPDQYLQITQYNTIGAAIAAVGRTWELSVLTVKSMGKMITGLIGLDNLSGPITIANVAKSQFDIGWQAVLSFAAIVSLSLGVLNLLPIPILDGGHILFYSVELIHGKPLPQLVQNLGMYIGMILMFLMMVIAIGNDLTRIW